MNTRAQLVLTSNPPKALSQSESRYCFRASWLSEYESLYSIFSKFAFANAVGVQQLAALFLRSPSNGAIKPVSLLDPSQFDLNSVSQQLRIEPKLVQSAFLTDHADQCRSAWISNVLRYCPVCIAKGYHSILFQSRYLSSCPIHGRSLRTGCLNRHCKHVLEFRLTSATFRYPYACPSCQESYAVNFSLTKPSTQSHSIPEIAHLATAAAHIRQTQRLQYGTFIDESFDSQPDWIQMVGGPNVGRPETDNEVPELVSAVHQRSHSQAAGAEDRGRTQGQLVSVRGILGKQEDGTRSKQLVNRRPSPEKSVRVWGGPWFQSDKKLQYAVETYRGVRRMLWRVMMGEHRVCFDTAAKHIWWNARGMRSVPFCSHAFAFLNWRMFWEGIGTPQHLMLQATHSPFGIVSWLSTSSPMLPEEWSDEARLWFTMRVLAMECRWTFDAWAGIALAGLDHNCAQWGDRWIPRFEQPRYWVGEVTSSPKSHVSIHFLHKAHRPTLPKLSKDELATHRAWHLEQLATIIR